MLTILLKLEIANYYFYIIHLLFILFFITILYCAYDGSTMFDICRFLICKNSVFLIFKQIVSVYLCDRLLVFVFFLHVF